MAEIPVNSADLNAAIRALEAQGIPTTHQAVLNWVAQHRPVRMAPAMPEQEPRPTRTSQAEPSIPQNKGSSRLARFARPQSESKHRRKPGRPLTIASWFPAVAKTMGDGTTLRTALAMNRLTLSANEMRALYRNKTFKGLYQEARRRYLIENWGRKAPSLRALLGRCI
jgi:hypothetical protein